MEQWWGEWQLRILVLASLSAQYFLVLFAGVCKFHIPPWLRFSFRLAHIGSDALAIFALATLFNRQKSGPRCSYAPGSRDFELLWAPILLMHLGGQVVITTYKIEDNEQWRRHILKSLSKVTVALYVFYKSWSSDNKRLLAATILLFILVIIRCFQKSHDLKSSSFNALRKASSSVVSSGIGVKDSVRREEDFEEYFMSRAGRIVSKPPGIGGPPSLPFELLLDIPCSYSDRLTMLRKFWSLDYKSSHHAIERGLSTMTSFLYTKDDSTAYLAFKNAPAALIFRRCTQVLAYATVITAICLVRIRGSHKEADSGVTLVLLYGTLLLELVYLCVQSGFRDKFSGRILQHNLIGFAHSSRHSTLRSIAGWLQCNSLLDGFWHMKPSSYSCEEITKLVRSSAC
uniref:Uncharacterized protein n=1 Tax=Avena sativa TaxID=4498 RepID=A0ACD5YA29_AVESA